MSSHPERPFNELVARLKESSRPIEGWAARSLEEIYLGGDFSIGRVKGPAMNLKYTPRALRVVSLHEGDYMGLSIVLFDATRDEMLALGRELRREQTELPDVGTVDERILGEAVTSTLSRYGKQTVAALEIGRAIEGSKIVQVLYPNLLRSLVVSAMGSLGMRLDEATERDIALKVAIKFLNLVPYASSEPITLTPENSPTS